MSLLAALYVLLGFAAAGYGGEAGLAQPVQEKDCAYRVQPGEDLGTILTRLGVQVIWGPKGAIREVLQRNPDVARRNGDFLLPDTLIHIPKQLLSKGDGTCSAVAVERDEAKRAQLYALAEKKILTGNYKRVCRAFIELAGMPAQEQDRERILHFAALCEYENNDWAAAQKLWMKVLQTSREPDLRLRANYNLALIECQRDQAARGYERLGRLDPAVLFHEAEFEQRSFVMLVEYCAEKAGGNDARLTALRWLSESAGSTTIREYAKAREQGMTVASIPPVETKAVPRQPEPATNDYRQRLRWMNPSPSPRQPASN